MSADENQVGGTHYKTQKIQHWTYVIANQMPYLDAQAFKYIDRHARKNGRQALEKAKHFIDKMIETYYPGDPMVPVELRGPSLHSDLSKAVGLCPNHSLGEHQWSWIYRHGADGRIYEVQKCDLCQEERERV